MSVLGRLLVSSSERLDLPDFLSIDSFGAGDWKFFMKSLVGDSKPYILRGFEITDPELSIGTTSVSVGVADSIVYYPGSSAGPFFHGLEEGNALSVDLVPELKKSATNFVYLTLSTTNAARDTRNFWDPDLNGGEGGEFSQDIDTESVLVAEINVSVSSFPANTIPVAKVIMDATSVVSIEDSRDLLFRLGTGGQVGDPFNDYDFRSLPSASYERDEPNALMTNALDPNPFQGGDKNIFTVKEWMDVVMTSIKEMKGSTYWYSGGAGSWPGSLGNLRADTAHSVITGNSLATHSAATAGLMNWSGNMHIKFLSGRLNFKVLSNAATTDITLADGQVAYLNLVRGEDIVPKLILTNGSAIVTSFAAAIWTSDLVVGDFVRLKTDQDNQYYEIQSIDSGSQVTLTSNFTGTSTGSAGVDAVRAFGEYQTDAAPSTNRHVQIANRLNVPLSEDVYWLFFRDDDGSAVPKIYTRFKAGEIEQGETIQIADNTSQAVIDFIGSAGEADGTPDYVTSATGSKTGQTDYNSVANENLAARISRLTSMVADKAQDKTIKFTSDHNNVTNTTNATDQEITFSGGTPEMTVIVPSSANNGTIGLGGTLTLAANQAAVYTIDRNASFSLANLAALTVVDTDLVTLDENTFIFAYRLSGTEVFLWDNTVISAGTTVPSTAYAQLISQQNNNKKLISGGTWSWDLGTTSLSFTSDAYLQMIGLNDVRNTVQQSSQSPIVLAANEVAYIAVNRETGAASNRTVIVANINAITPSDDLIIIARRDGSDVIIGNSSFKLRDGESKPLDAGSSDQILTYTGQVNRADSDPNYTSSVIVTQGDSLTDTISELDAEVGTPTYTSDIRGTAAEALKARMGVLTDALGDQQEDRSAYLRSEENITWTGAQVEFTKDIVLDIINTKSGVTTTHTIQLAGSPVTLTAGESAWVEINRTAVSENLTINKSGTLAVPAQVQGDKDVFILFKRVSNVTSTGEELYVPLNNQLFIENQSARLGAGGGGAGGGGLDVYLAEDFEATSSTDFSTGNNATFLGAGALNGVLSNETVSPIAGKRSIKYTAGAAATNDYIASPVIDLDAKQKENDSGVTFYFTWDGTTDIEVVAWDETNSVKLNSIFDVINVVDNPTRYSATFFPSSTTSQIRYGFHFLVAPTNGDILIFDDLELSTNPFTYKELVEYQSGNISQAGSAMTNRDVPRFDLSGFTFIGPELVSVEDNTIYGTRFVANRDCRVTLNWSCNAANPQIFYRDTDGSTSLGVLAAATVVGSGANDKAHVSGTVDLKIGQSIGIGIGSTDVANNAEQALMSFAAQATTEHVVTPATSNINSFGLEGNGGEAVSAVIDMPFAGSGLGWSGSAYTVQYNDSIITISGNVEFTANTRVHVGLFLNGVRIREYTDADVGSGSVTSVDQVSYISHKGEFSEGDVLSLRPSSAQTLFNSTDGHFLSITESKDAQFLAAVPIQKVAYIKDIKPSATNAGTFTSGSYQTRDLNTIEGDASMVSVSSNQFTLSRGTYLVQAWVPAFKVASHKAKLVNITDSTEKIGSSEFCNNNDDTSTSSIINTVVEITTAKVYEIQHRCTVTSALNGLGIGTAYGDDEVYTNVKITKLR